MKTIAKVVIIAPELRDGEQPTSGAAAISLDLVESAPISKRRKRKTIVHQVTTSEAVSEWRNEGNPN